MKIEKENNQYYAEYIESRVVSLINKEDYILPDCLQNFLFPVEDLEEMNKDAEKIAKTLGGKTAIWVGRSCGNEKCDILIDDHEVELKYVSCGSGTYLNSSLSYFSDRLGFTSFKDYTSKELLPFLKNYFGDGVYNNLSPVSIEQSKEIRHNQPDLYKQIQKIDKETRKDYVNDLYNFLISNPDKMISFVNDCITKNVGNKHTPEVLFIFNHETKKITVYSKEEIERKVKNTSIKKTSLGLVFDNFRVAIGWQNGNGLNNPTFRVFLK